MRHEPVNASVMVSEKQFAWIKLHHKTCDSCWYWISPVWARLKRLPRKLKITLMQPVNFRVMTRVKLASLLQLLKALRKVECQTTFERGVVARRAKENAQRTRISTRAWWTAKVWRILLDRATFVFCVRKCNSVSMDPTELPSSSTRVFWWEWGASGHSWKIWSVKGDRCFSPLDVEMIDQLLTLEVLCPRAQWIMRRQFRQREKVHYSMNLESVLGESLQHYGIKRNVPFTNRTGSTMNVKCWGHWHKTCSSVCAQGLRQRLDDRVHSRWKLLNSELHDVYWPSETDHGEHTRIRHCVWQRSLRVGRGRQWWSLCQRW